MYRDQAYEMLRLMAAFDTYRTGITVVDFDHINQKVELRLPNGDKEWMTFTNASKCIEANSN